MFLALPEDASADIAPAAARARPCASSTCRAPSACATTPIAARWYHAVTALPDGHGLRHDRADRARRCQAARLVACAGCYPTAAVLALAPLVAAGLVAGDIVIDAKSGVSGAGKAPSERTHFCEVDESLSAYGVFAHRHAAEIEQELGVAVTFVPHLVPLDRGILETIYVRVPAGTTEARHCRRLRGAPTRASPFVRLRGGDLPVIKHVAHTNFCDIGWKLDERDGPAGRRLVHRQPAEGRGRTGGAELQRRVRLRRADGACSDGGVTLLKLGGELLEQPERLAALAAASSRRRDRSRWSSCTAAAGRSTRRWRAPASPKRQVDGLRVTDGHARASSSRCWPAR